MNARVRNSADEVLRETQQAGGSPVDSADGSVQSGGTLDVDMPVNDTPQRPSRLVTKPERQANPLRGEWKALPGCVSRSKDISDHGLSLEPWNHSASHRSPIKSQMLRETC